MSFSKMIFIFNSWAPKRYTEKKVSPYRHFLPSLQDKLGCKLIGGCSTSNSLHHLTPHHGLVLAQSLHRLLKIMQLKTCKAKIQALTSSPVLWRQMNLPSVSISLTQTGPVAEAEWAMDTELLASCSSTSMRFLFPWVVRTLRLLDDARDTVTRDEGLGDSFSLGEGRTS